MTSVDLQQQINKHNYWEMLIDELNVDYFCSRVEIKYYNDKSIYYSFINCYKLNFNHCLKYDIIAEKQNGDFSPCFFRDITVNDIEIEGRKLYEVKIDAYPVSLEIWCESIEIKEKSN
ncbi:hypothetical protein P8V03_09840 [Clostridium sp. A1-XYC3]|uniref:Uncharacterized protein n=1 Tax=Clostridium tanneri TaxID=3037988 RepID=A0ABU4JTG5_9CLOT|nr:hypothetical protein [Clostridium sp. A1-XYC3]MDW8801455.1 hypothetical protein [Clostridium sp. A1-XYC3]